MPALTPDTPVYSKRVFSFIAYGDMDWIAIVKGALLSVAYESNWVQYGTMTPEDTAEEVKRIIFSMEKAVSLIGTIVPIATQDIPDGMLLCDGSNYDSFDYPDLFAVIADDLKFMDTFDTPDLRARFILGANATTYLPFYEGGEETHTLITGEMPSHSHSNTPHAHSEGSAIPALGEITAGVPFAYATATPSTTGLTSIDIANTGGDDPHNNMPPFYVLRYCIIAKHTA